MMRVESFFLASLLFCSFAMAKQDSDFLEFGLAPSDLRSEKLTHLQVKLGIENIKYNSGHDYQGANKQFSPGETSLLGASLVFGYQMQVIDAYSVTLNAGWFHTSSGSDESESELTDRDFRLYGSKYGLEFGFEFQKAAFIWQPFVELGTGSGNAKFDIDYERTETGSSESYNAKISDTFAHNYFGFGLNILNNKGLFSFIKLTLFQFSGISRSYSGTQKVSNAAAVEPLAKADTGEQIDSFSYPMISIGMGYTF